jgi:general secretion pathway protein A
MFRRRERSRLAVGASLEPRPERLVGQSANATGRTAAGDGPEHRRVEVVSRSERQAVDARPDARKVRATLAMDIALDPSRPHPFAHDFDPDAFYRSPVHESVLAALVSTIQIHTGFLVLVGEPGTGKTAVLQRVARDLEHGAVRVLLASALRPPHEMFLPVDGEPGPPGAVAPTTWGASFFTTLRARVRAEGATAVAVDDAQRLTLTELRFLRDLAEAERAAGRRLVILLVGRPGLDVKFARLEEEEGGHPAFTLRVHLEPLDPSDVGAYMARRLERQGLRLDDVFTEDAVDRVIAYTRGLPRMINQLCYAALHTATEAGRATVSASSIEAAAGWLELDVDRDQPQPVGRGTPPQVGTWAHRAASARARMEPAARGAGAMLIVAGLAIVRGVGAGARVAVSAGPPLGLRIVAAVAALMAAVARTVGQGVRTGARGITAAAAVVWSGLRGVGVLVAAAGHAAGRALSACVRGVVSALVMLGTVVASVGALGAATARDVGRAVSAGARGVVSTVATLGAAFVSLGVMVATVAHGIWRTVRVGLRGLAVAVESVGAAVAGLGRLAMIGARGVGRGARAGVHGVVAAVTLLGAGGVSLGALVAAAAHGVGPAARAGTDGVTAAVRGLGAAVVGLGTLMAATARGVGRGVSAGVHALAVAGVMLWAWIERVTRTLATTGRRAERDVGTSVRGLTAAGATIGTRAGKAAASVAAGWRTASRRTEAWVTGQAAAILPQVRTLPPGAVFTVLSLVTVTLVLTLWPISYAPPSIERPPPADIVESLERPPEAERAPAPRAVSPGGTRRRESLRSPAPPARGPVTFTTARPPSDR